MAPGSVYRAIDREQLKSQPLEHPDGRVLPIISVAQLATWCDLRAKQLQHADDPQSKRWLQRVTSARRRIGAL
jgi:hypothetical protein